MTTGQQVRLGDPDTVFVLSQLNLRPRDEHEIIIALRGDSEQERNAAQISVSL
jgi:hypothetical protein